MHEVRSLPDLVVGPPIAYDRDLTVERCQLFLEQRPRLAGGEIAQGNGPEAQPHQRQDVVTERLEHARTWRLRPS